MHESKNLWFLLFLEAFWPQAHGLVDDFIIFLGKK